MPKTIFCSVLSIMLLLAFVADLRAQEEAPKFFTLKESTSADLARAVNYFVSLGEEETAITLASIANKQTSRSKIDLAFRVACVCRILWQNPDTPLVPPNLGIYGGGVSIDPRNQSDLNEWPLFPVAKSGVSYFVVVSGGRGGTGQSANLKETYIQYCQSNGTFITEEIPVPTNPQFQADAELLRESDRWSQEFRENRDDTIWLSIQSQFPKNAR